jgi:hypothetical protein
MGFGVTEVSGDAFITGLVGARHDSYSRMGGLSPRLERGVRILRL